MDAAAGGPRKTLRDLITLTAQGISSSIDRSTIEVNNFELRLAFLLMVQQTQYGGSPMEDPNLHLSIFLEVCDTLKLNGVSPDVIRVRLFLFLLKDKARTWLYSLPPNSIATWDKLTTGFLAKFFPSRKMTSLRNQITTFTQEDESL